MREEEKEEERQKEAEREREREREREHKEMNRIIRKPFDGMSGFFVLLLGSLLLSGLCAKMAKVVRSVTLSLV